jgi:hypothetical protein
VSVPGLACVGYDPLEAAVRNAFANAEKGVWLDPSDFSTLYQDSAGTTPVTAVGQSVGLILDKSQNFKFGPELVTNGDFSNGTTGWGAYYQFSVSANELTATSSAVSNHLFYQNINIVTGVTYKLIFTVTSNYASHVGIVLDTASVTLSPPATGTYTTYIVGTSTGSKTLVFDCAGANGTMKFKNISCKQIYGNHATQATAAYRPILGREPLGGRRNLLLATDSLSTQTYTTAAVAHTLTFTGTGTVALTGTATHDLVGTGASDRVSYTFTPSAGILTLTVSGTVTLSQLELGSTATAYQKVVDQYDVTEVGKRDLYYLQFDGSNDYLVTPSIDFTGTDKMGIWLGFRAYNRGGPGGIIAMQTTDGIVFYYPNGEYYVRMLEGSAWSSTGKFVDGSLNTNYVGLDKSGTNKIVFNLNNVNIDNVTTGSYHASFCNYPLMIGSREENTLPYKGRIYSLIVLGALSTAGQIQAIEAYTNKMTGAY